MITFLKKKLPYQGIIGGFIFLLLWELLGRSKFLPAYYLPPFTSVVSQFADKEFLFNVTEHLSNTLVRALIGYALSFIIAIPLGIVLGRSPSIGAYLEPILESLRPLPSSAVIPVALLFLGLGWKMIVFVVAFGALWPTLVATIQGARNVDPVMLDTAKLLQLNSSQTNYYIVLPASLPYIMAGLRTSLAVSLILAVTAEMIAGGNGIGFYILDMERAFRTKEMFAAIMIIGVAGYILNTLFEAGEKRVIYWKE